MTLCNPNVSYAFGHWGLVVIETNSHQFTTTVLNSHILHTNVQICWYTFKIWSINCWKICYYWGKHLFLLGGTPPNPPFWFIYFLIRISLLQRSKINICSYLGETPQAPLFDLKKKKKKKRRKTFRTSLFQRSEMLKDLLLSGETHHTQPTCFCWDWE